MKPTDQPTVSLNVGCVHEPRQRALPKQSHPGLTIGMPQAALP